MTMNYNQRNYLGTIIVLVLLFSFSIEVKSTNMDEASKRKALSRIKQEQNNARQNGFNEDDYKIYQTSLPRLNSKLVGTISPGKYAIFAGCDDDCNGVKITVKDERNKELSKKLSNISNNSKHSAHFLINEIPSNIKRLKFIVELKCDEDTPECYSYFRIWKKKSLFEFFI